MGGEIKTVGLLMACGLKKKSKGHQYDCQYFRKFSGAGKVPMNERFYVYSSEEAAKLSKEFASAKLLFRVKHQCKASQVSVFVKGEFPDRSISIVAPKGQENPRVISF